MDEFTQKDLQAIYEEVESQDVRGIDDFYEEFLDEMKNGHIPVGIKLPWPATHDIVRLRYEDVSVWAGINGHKKSTLISQVMLHAANDVPVGIMSFELTRQKVAALMCRQAACCMNVAEDYQHRFANWAIDKLWFYRCLGGADPLQVLGAARAMANRGCKLIVIDNLQFCRVTDDSERERKFMNELVSLASALKIHIALIHHVRKPHQSGDDYIPTKFDVKGSGSITDQAAQVFIVWHNKRRAEALRKQEYGIPLSDYDQKALEGTDQKLIVAKQRHAEFEGAIGLYNGGGRTFKKREKEADMYLDLSAPDKSN